jgi:hypothetical protein
MSSRLRALVASRAALSINDSTNLILGSLLVGLLAARFKSRAQLEAEILILRDQLGVLRRRAPKRVVLGGLDRLILALVYRLFPRAVAAVTIIRPETIRSSAKDTSLDSHSSAATSSICPRMSLRWAHRRSEEKRRRENEFLWAATARSPEVW